MKPIVSKNDDRHRRIANIVGKTRLKAVVVDEDGIQILVKESSRDLPLKLIESNVKKFEKGKLKNHIRKPTGEPVVAEIELIQDFQIHKFVRHDAAEPIGIDVEQS